MTLWINCIYIRDDLEISHTDFYPVFSLHNGQHNRKKCPHVSNQSMVKHGVRLIITQMDQLIKGRLEEPEDIFKIKRSPK